MSGIRIYNENHLKHMLVEAQYIRHRPIAVNSFADTSSHNNMAAWQAALSRTSKVRGHGWESDVLRTMLMHYGSCCASTSSVERRFSKNGEAVGHAAITVSATAAA